MKKYLVFLAALCLLSGCGRKGAEPRVQNVILMIGDGMGLPHLTALSLEQEYAPTEIERARCIGIQKTYSANNRITDSAAAGTALATGEKTENGMIGILPDGSIPESVLKTAQEEGKATGIVVTFAPTDATPAAFVAHNSDRDTHESTALQYLDSGIDVIAGSCRHYFDQRADGRNLIEEMGARGYAFAPDRKAMLSAAQAPLLALFPYEAIPYAALDSLGTRGDYLTEAVSKTIELLDGTGKDGFFLMVESSYIDWAAHDGEIEYVVAEMRDFDRAVGAAYDYADSHPGTLVIVTGDHETGGLTIVSPNSDYKSGDWRVKYDFSTDGHSGTFIPVFAYGTGSENFSGVMENTEIARRLKALIAPASQTRSRSMH